MLRIATARLPPQLVAAPKHAASFHNPEFYRHQNQRFSTFNTPGRRGWRHAGSLLRLHHRRARHRWGVELATDDQERNDLIADGIADAWLSGRRTWY